MSVLDPSRRAEHRSPSPCRRSRVRVPSSALGSSCKSTGSVVLDRNGPRSAWQGSLLFRRATDGPKSPRPPSKSRETLVATRGQESPASHQNLSATALGRAYAGQPVLNPPFAAARRRRLQKVICRCFLARPRVRTAWLKPVVRSTFWATRSDEASSAIAASTSAALWWSGRPGVANVA